MKPLTPRQLEAAKIVSEGRFIPSLRREDDGWYARWCAIGADNFWVDEFVRTAAITPLSADAEGECHETLHDAWIMALRSRSGRVVWDERECELFAEELKRWASGADENSEARRKIVFRFSADGEGFSISSAAHRTRSELMALSCAARIVPALRNMKRKGGASAKRVKMEVLLSRAEAESFLRSGAKELADAGFAVEGCDIASHISASADLIPVEGGAKGERVFDRRLQIRVDGEVVDIEEIRFLIEQKSTLVFFRNRWIEVDRNVLKEALRVLERQNGQKISVNEALAFASGIGFAGRLQIEELAAHGWLRGLIHSLKSAGRGTLEKIGEIKGLEAKLTDYQKRGVAWMKFLADNGFGALLADEMGLGKTVQTIAWLLLARKKGDAPALVVAPLTLLPNWKHEFAKFAPHLAVYVHQGSMRQLEYGFKLSAAKADVVITSYSLFVKDYSIFQPLEWFSLVLDEAQVAKNPDTRVARAAIALSVKRRIALTGTPIENSVADIWSLQNFLNPGFLGDRKSFTERFVKPIALDEKSTAAKRLQHALEPFVLRRLKSDSDVASELGGKREIKEYCVLTPADRVLYENALEDYRVGERRRGDMFALLTRLKLICDGEGKMARLVDLLEGIFAVGESVLIFTQYTSVGERVRKVLKEKFGRLFPFLNGSLSSAAREAEVAAFAGTGEPSAFILSLRSGAFGLNLTKATHVIHFDRWWNPAVESQATDRAHRIGQKKTVFVHAFITEGTLEERIDKLLERKFRVAGTLVQPGENFLRSLSGSEFEEIVALSGKDEV